MGNRFWAHGSRGAFLLLRQHLIDRNMFFKLKEGSRTRGHKAALVKEQCRLDMRKYSFSQRVINEWNKLPNDCVNASSVNMFKNRIDRCMIRAGYT